MINKIKDFLIVSLVAFAAFFSFKNKRLKREIKDRDEADSKALEEAKTANKQSAKKRRAQREESLKKPVNPSDFGKSRKL